MLLVYRIVLLQMGLRFNATCRNTSLVEVGICTQMQLVFFTSVPSKVCLASNAETPSSVILSQHIATFFLVG